MSAPPAKIPKHQKNDGLSECQSRVHGKGISYQERAVPNTEA